MKLDPHPPLTSSDSPITDILDPLALIEAMLDLRLQLAELEQQIAALQPAFYAACAALNLEKIATERATISRRLSPAQWAYSADILEHEAVLKHLKQQFQQSHEPVGGRKVIWAIKLLLATV